MARGVVAVRGMAYEVRAGHLAARQLAAVSGTTTRQQAQLRTDIYVLLAPP